MIWASCYLGRILDAHKHAEGSLAIHGVSQEQALKTDQAGTVGPSCPNNDGTNEVKY